MVRKVLLTLISLFALAGSAQAYLYENHFTSGSEPPTNWSGNGVFDCTYSPGNGVVHGTGPATFSWYYNNGYSWTTETDTQFTMSYCETASFVFGVRFVTGNGYIFTKTLASGTVTSSVVWNTITQNDSFAISSGDVFLVSVRGTGASTTLKIYQNSTLRCNFSNPATVHDSGTILLGFVNPAGIQHYCYFDDLTVADANATATPTFTPIPPTPTFTSTATPSVVYTPTYTPTPSPTVTVSPTVATTPPAWVNPYPYIQSQGAQSINVAAEVDKNGYAHFLALLHGESAPTSSQVYTPGSYNNFTISTGTSESNFLLYANNYIYATAGNYLKMISPSANTVAATSNAIAGLWEACYGAGYIFATDNAGQWIYKIDPNTLGVVNSVNNVGLHPAGIIFAYGSVWFSCNDGNTYVKMDPSTMGITQYSCPDAGVGPYNWCDDGTNLWLTCNIATIYKINPSTGSVIFTFNTSNGLPTALDVNHFSNPMGIVKVGNYLYVSDTRFSAVYVINYSTNTIVQTIHLSPIDGSYLYMLTYDGTYIYAANYNYSGFSNGSYGSGIFVIDPTNNSVVNFITGSGMTFPFMALNVNSTLYVTNYYSANKTISILKHWISWSSFLLNNNITNILFYGLYPGITYDIWAVAESPTQLQTNPLLLFTPVPTATPAFTSTPTPIPTPGPGPLGLPRRIFKQTNGRRSVTLDDYRRTNKIDDKRRYLLQ